MVGDLHTGKTTISAAFSGRSRELVCVCGCVGVFVCVGRVGCTGMYVILMREWVCVQVSVSERVYVGYGCLVG